MKIKPTRRTKEGKAINFNPEKMAAFKSHGFHRVDEALWLGCSRSAQKAILAAGGVAAGSSSAAAKPRE